MRRTAFFHLQMSLLASLPVVIFMGLETYARDADIGVLFSKAEAAGRTGLAKKTKPVDVRPAKAGEVVVTQIKGEGKETESKPAEAGDMVVRNRCAETGNEEQLVKAAKFAERYEGPVADVEQPADAAQGWAAFRPRGNEMKYFIVSEAEGSFTFAAPWGEPMVARPGDAIVRDVKDAKDTYRIARAAFECTYEIVARPPKD